LPHFKIKIMTVVVVVVVVAATILVVVVGIAASVIESLDRQGISTTCSIRY
jgi:hypothetical protein